MNANCINRTCFTCKKDKNISGYYKNNKKSDGIDTICSECRTEYRRNWNKKFKNKGYKWDSWKPGYKVCSTCQKELKFLEFHKSKLGLYGLKTNCKPCEYIRNKVYKRKNNWENNYRKERRRTDPQFKIKDNLRCRLNDALR